MEEYQGRVMDQRSPQAHARRKGNGSRPWRVISESGHSHLEQVRKHALMRRTGLHTRDFRLLDPALLYSSSILGRERAIVINLEHIKAIVTAKEVFLVNSSNPLMVQFVEDLKSRIVGSNATPHQPMERNEESSEPGVALSSDGGQCSSNLTVTDPETQAPKLLPFEFRVLEACLESACRCLDSETETLEEEAYPALDELTSKISTLNLERVRQIKSRLVSISGRVQKVRDELEHLLDDDDDMAEMYLTEKLRTCFMDRSLSRKEVQNASAEMNHDSGVGDSENNSEISVTLKTIRTEELEMLLEAYFVQLEGILRKLSHMNEYVGDTEDYINIMLDDKQNQLLQMSVVLNCANMILNAGIVVVGLFGMNIHISLFDAQPIKFWETTYGTIGGCIALYLIAVGWGRKRYMFT